MRSPQKTDHQFNDTNFGLYLTCYIPIVKPILDQYQISLTQVRIMGAISAIKALFGWRSVNIGITITQIHRATGFAPSRIKYLLPALIEKGLVKEDITIEGKRRTYRYELTRTGKIAINQIIDREKVNERIVSYLYERKLLK